ncbi:MAG: hypothetical protein SFY66_19535 [Oculatellaceae cyanobacterium bins.114]|nr:hypothetical protein [Oculatellaceae cyanobacterium bins.114]
MQLPNFEQIGKILDEAEPIEMAIMPFRAFVLVGQIQLALRHPQNRGPSADVARDMAIRLQARLGQIHPAIAEALEHGWHPEFDVSDEEFKALQDKQPIFEEEVVFEGEQCPDCGSINTATSFHAPSWWQCGDCQTAWQTEEAE